MQERRDAKKELKRKQRNKPPKPSVRAERRPEAASLTTEASEKTPSIELEHVRGVYNAIAPQWHGTRYKAWPRVAKFCLMNCGKGTLVADVGCGNGKMADAACPTRRMVKLILRVDGVGERRSTPSTRSSLLASRRARVVSRRSEGRLCRRL